MGSRNPIFRLCDNVPRQAQVEDSLNERKGGFSLQWLQTTILLLGSNSDVPKDNDGGDSSHHILVRYHHPSFGSAPPTHSFCSFAVNKEALCL